MLAGFYNPAPVFDLGWSLLGIEAMVSTAEIATFTFLNVPLGPVGERRKLNLLVDWAEDTNNFELLTVTIGGVSASRIVRAVNATAISNTEIWELAPAPGSALDQATTATVVFTFSGAVEYGMGATILPVYNSGPLISTTFASNAASGNGLTATGLDLAEGGYAIAIGRTQDNASTHAIPIFNTSLKPPAGYIAASGTLRTTAATNQSVVLTYTGNSTFRRLCAASWGRP